MELPKLLAVVLFTWLGTTGAAALNETHNLEWRALSINDIPPCGLACLSKIVPSTGCTLSDFDCQCQNTELSQTILACMLSNCIMDGNLSTAKAQYDICNFSNESRQHDIYVYTITCYVIPMIFILLRLAGRLLTKRFSIDDYVVVGAMCLMLIPMALVVKMAGIGFGQHFWNLHQGQLLKNLRFFYIAWITYNCVLGLTKISLTLFYYEVFPSEGARIVSLILLSWIAINTLVLVFLTIFNCSPVQAFWDRDIKNAKCLNINALAYANSACAIAQDVTLLIFPLVCIWNLNMNRWRKIAVAFMFAIGTLGCIATIVRLHSFRTFKTSMDPTWDFVPVTIWSGIELACCIICISLPAVRILFVRMLPESFFSTISSRLRSIMRTEPDMGANNTNTNPVPSRGVFRSWLHISTDHSESTGQSTELSTFSTARMDEHIEKGFDIEACVEEGRNAVVEEEPLPAHPRYTL